MDDNEELILALSEHRTFGWMFHVYSAGRMEDGNFCLLSTPEAGRLSPDKKKLIALASKIADQALMKVFSREKAYENASRIYPDNPKKKVVGAEQMPGVPSSVRCYKRDAKGERRLINRLQAEGLLSSDGGKDGMLVVKKSHASLLAHSLSKEAAEDKLGLVCDILQKLSVRPTLRAYQQEGWKYAMLTGETLRREETIKRFGGNEDVCAFLISLKAESAELNLTAADYVFILDPWWNPVAEVQALSRAHHIGQKRMLSFIASRRRKSKKDRTLTGIQGSPARDVCSRKQSAVAMRMGGNKGITK
jgi:hypothetical protein